MNDIHQLNIRLEKELFQRIQKLSEILDLPLNHIINISLLKGILSLWIPYQKLLSDISDKESPINEEDYQDVLDDLITQMNSDFEAIRKLDLIEEEFEEIYPFGSFTDLPERKIEFLKFLKTYNEEEEVEIEEITQEPVQEKIKVVSAKSAKEEEKELPPSLFLRFGSFIKSQIDSHVNNLGDVIILGIFFILLGVINFFIFYSLYLIWPIIFDFGYMITTYAPWISVISIIIIILLFPIIILLTGFIIGKVYYYLIKILCKKKQH